MCVCQRAATPWPEILRCPAVWGAVVTHCGSAIGYIFIFTEIPLYINSILGVDIKRVSTNVQFYVLLVGTV